MAAPSKTTLMRPAPSHLDAILTQRKPLAAPRGQSGVGGRIECVCGGSEFKLHYAARRVESEGAPFLRVVTRWGRPFFVVTVECVRCSKSRTLLDYHLHGWEGVLCSTPTDRKAKPPRSKRWICPTCGFSIYAVSIAVMGDDKSEALQNSEGALTEDNWFDAFGSMVISTVCVNCRATQTIAECETQ